jgi:hypothetical protein
MWKDRFEAAPTFEQHLEGVEKNRELWHAFYDRARVPEDLVERLRDLPELRILVLSEDWCGDAVNTLPLIARMAEAAPNIDLRVIGRDDHPELMDSHTTDGSRSIPVVIVYDRAFNELAWWGPRPTDLQRWVVDEGLSMPSKDRYRQIRRWYAVDRGRTTMEEVLDKLFSSLRRTAA